MQPTLRLLSLATLILASSSHAAEGDTQVLKWKDGKKAAFMLAFDDSAPSQLKNVVPELEKRKIVGNFYLVTGNGLYSALRLRWELAARSPYVAIANHTFTHKGVNNTAELEPELARCNEVLYKLKPEGKQPRLFGFGRPGGVPWKVTPQEQADALAKHQLCDRPPFAGPPINYKSAEATVAAVDAAIAKGEMGHLDFHGVGEDWLVTPVEWFTALLDKLESVRDQVWITDVVSWHQYVTERSTAEVKNSKAAADTITLELTCKADPALYDLPLTLSTSVPADWKKASITQGANTSTATPRAGSLQYDALPDGGVITLKKSE
ncbi:polysaccharide deacetylase family protein [Prosthecobacter sp.]|uniref:polysaccharide deacetylase family protein n=1 Tax=Prosthecobacter sp. TaxID=1965333 RepID=UPI003782F7F3